MFDRNGADRNFKRRNKMNTREEWLVAAAQKAEVELFKPNGYTLPKYRVTCGFPSKSGLASKKRRIGECWSPSASNDNTTEIIVSMTIDDPKQAIGILIHEMVHASVGCEHGHRGAFRKCALAVGLEGKMTSTTESQQLVDNFINPVIKELGEYPHSAIDYSQRKKQSTRMIKIECSSCGIKFRASRTVADQCHVCPVCEEETLIIG